MKYRVLETDEVFDDIDDVLDFCIEDDYHEDDNYEFEDWVCKMYDGVTIAGTYYSAYTILENAEDGLLDNLLRDYCESANDSDYENGEYELKNAYAGEKIDVQAYTIRVEDDDEDEAGDYDGDFSIETLRQSIEAQKNAYNTTSIEEKENEKDIMSLFQRVGG